MKFIKLFFLFFAMSAGVWAQVTDSPNRDVSLKIVNKRGRPMGDVLVQSLHTGSTGFTDRFGLFVFRNMADDDSISVILPKYGKTILPVAGLDSIVMMLQTKNSYVYVNKTGQTEYVRQSGVKTLPNTLIDVPELLKRYPYNSLADLLKGRVAGLNISITEGRDAQPTVTAGGRGQNSIMVSQEPLVVIDGMPIGTLGEANRFVNVYDIKTIEVQKGSSEWGARGANGVILLNTKK